MNDNEIVKALREHAEWAQENEWECPITLGDDLRKAADLIESLQAQLAKKTEEAEGMRSNWYKCIESLKESQQADIAAKDKHIEWTAETIPALNKQIRDRRADLAEANRRAAAAVEDIMCRDHCDVCKHSHAGVEDCEKYDFECGVCKSEKCVCRNCRDENKWEWRGSAAGEESR